MNEDKEIIEKIKNGELKYSNLSEPLKKNKELIYKAIKKNEDSLSKRDMIIYAFIKSALEDNKDDFNFIKLACCHRNVINYIPEHYIKNKKTFLELVGLHEDNLLKTYHGYENDQDVFHIAVKTNSENLKFFSDDLKSSLSNHQFLIDCLVNLEHMPEEYKSNIDLALPFIKIKMINRFHFNFESVSSEDEVYKILNFKANLFKNLPQKYREDKEIIKFSAENGYKNFIQDIPVDFFKNEENVFFILDFLEDNNYMNLDYTNVVNLTQCKTIKDVSKTIEKRESLADLLRQCSAILERQKMKKEKIIEADQKPKLKVKRKF